jgi:hypothetical protein
MLHQKSMIIWCSRDSDASLSYNKTLETSQVLGKLEDTSEYIRICSETAEDYGKQRFEYRGQRIPRNLHEDCKVYEQHWQSLRTEEQFWITVDRSYNFLPGVKQYSVQKTHAMVYHIEVTEALNPVQHLKSGFQAYSILCLSKSNFILHTFEGRESEGNLKSPL